MEKVSLKTFLWSGVPNICVPAPYCDPFFLKNLYDSINTKMHTYLITAKTPGNIKLQKLCKLVMLTVEKIPYLLFSIYDETK